MKRLVLILFIVLFVATAVNSASQRDYMAPSAVKTADALIKTGVSYFYGLVVATDGTNSVTFKVYDNTSAAGTKVIPDWIVTTSSSNRMSAISFDPPLPCSTGIYVDITTSGSVSYIAYYR